MGSDLRSFHIYQRFRLIFTGQKDLKSAFFASKTRIEEER